MTKTDGLSAADRAVLSAARDMQRLESGPLAELRRMNDRSGAPMFWRFTARHPNTIGCTERQTEWMTIIRILAVLYDKGEPANRPPLHDFGRPLGAVLCDGGNPSWPQGQAGTAQPVYSERRLAQLLTSRSSQRRTLLERAARALAQRRVPGSGVSITDIAHALLEPHDARRLAEPYYRRLDRALWTTDNVKEGQE